MNTAREAALDILLQIEKSQSYSNLALHQALQKGVWNAADRRLLTELVYGVITRLNTLDYLISRLVKRGSKSLKPWVQQLLRLGLYQLTYLDRIPPFAAIHETVQIGKQRGHKGIAGLINGVLRSYLREKETLLPQQAQTISDKAVMYAHPEWMVKRYEQQYGEQVAREIFLAHLEPAPISLRINQLKIGREQWLQQWKEESGGAVPSEVTPIGVRLSQSIGNPALHPHYKQGLYSIQDESSMLVSEALNPPRDSQVLDMCAAPGGKTTHLAELMDNQGKITACDIHPHKMKLIRNNADRLGIHIIDTKVQDGRNAGQAFAMASFDYILLDAPCSGLGVIRRKPEIKWRKSLKDLQALTALQSELLDVAYRLLKPGGCLLYSTCTFEKSENQEQIQSFLARHKDMSLDEKWMGKLASHVREKAIKGKGWLQILPQHFRGDGFFIARLVKKRLKMTAQVEVIR